MSNNQNRSTATKAGCVAPASPSLDPTREAFDRDAFQFNPHLAVAKLVHRMNGNASFEQGVATGLAVALDRAAASAASEPKFQANHQAAGGPRRLPGSALVRPNRTSQASATRDLSFAPTEAEHAALLAGEHLAHDLLGSGMPDELAAQADAIAHYADPIMKAYAVRKLERRGVYIAEAAARHYLNHARPENLVFARTSHLARWYAEHYDLAGLETRDPLVTHLLVRPRVAWMPPAGVEHGLLLDRFHHTHQRDVIENDSWIRRKVAEDFARIDALLAPARAVNGDSDGPADASPRLGANLGVRVHAHRAPNVGIHFVPDYTADPASGESHPTVGTLHRLGGCEHCATRTSLPNSQTPTSTSTGAGTGKEWQA